MTLVGRRVDCICRHLVTLVTESPVKHKVMKIARWALYWTISRALTSDRDEYRHPKVREHILNIKRPRLGLSRPRHGRQNRMTGQG